MHLRVPSVCLLTISLLAAAAHGQQAGGRADGDQPQVTFRAEVNYVEVDVQVTDARGEPVEDLARADFEVYEEGRLQPVTVFSTVRIPMEPVRPGAAPVEPDVRSNAQPFAGRLYVLLLDDIHTHVMRSNAAKAAARRFVEEHMRPGDLAAVVTTSGNAAMSQELTSSKRLLLAAIDRFAGRKLRSAVLERMDDFYRRERARDPESERSDRDRARDPLEFERAHQARTAMGTIRAVADWLANVRGRRKALIFFSEGIDYDIYDLFGARHASAVLDEVRDAIAAATRANVNIYGVDPRGLGLLGAEGLDVQGLPNDPTQAVGIESLMREITVAQDSLRVLADETGGFASINVNDLGPWFDRLVRENSSYYVLGYQATNERRDGRYRRIEVRVKRPGLQVRARRGYVAPRGRAPESRVAGSAGTSPALMELLNSPLPTAGLTLETAAAAFRGTTAASVLVATQIDGRRFKFADRNGVMADALELSLIVIDRNGKGVAADRSAIELTLTPERQQVVAEHGFRLLSRLEVPPGRYQVRVAAQESGAGVRGSVHQDLEVPDFASLPLSMSGLVLTASSADRVPTARQDEQLAGALPSPPLTDRVFGQDDVLTLYCEVYDNRGGPPDTMDFVTTLTDESGRVVHRAAEERSSADLQPPRRAHLYSVDVPLDGVAPGSYVLRVQATSRRNRNTELVREIPIRVD